MSFLLALWLVSLGICLAMSWRRFGSGTLLLAYFLGLSLIHVPGAYIFTGEAPGLSGRDETTVGFQITLIAFAVTLCGAGFMRFLNSGLSGAVGRAVQIFRRDASRLVGVSRPLLFVGLGVYFLALPMAGFVPSLTAVISPLATMIIIAFWVIIHNVIVHRDYKLLIFLVLFLPLLPFSTLFFGGFIGFGIYWVIAIFSFYFVQAGTFQKLVILAVSPLFLSFGLSFGNAYFEKREGVREAVWYQDASAAKRLDSILAIADNFELFDLNNPDHLKYINLRLNQNFLIGTGVGRYRSGMTDLEYGGTVPLWSLIPRFLWASKPEVGGGRDVVERFAGIRFREGTSVGAGQPLEFYANFGLFGVVVGSFLWGIVIEIYDCRLARAFRSEDIRLIVKYGLPGITLLQPGGNLLEILIGFVGAVVMARPATWLLLRAIEFGQPHRHSMGRSPARVG